MNKNSKSTFKKIKKYACIALIFAIFSAASIILYSNSLTRNAKEYIAYKYGVTQSEITEVEEYKAHIETEFVLLEKFNIWVVPAKWVFNVDGKNFNVEYFQKHYVDDFQLEDLEIWCTEYLQDNVDSNISGIELYSDMIFHDNTYDIFSKRSRYYTVRSSKSLSYSDNKLWKQEDIGEFLIINLIIISIWEFFIKPTIFLNIVQQILTAVTTIWCRPLIIMPQFQTALLHRFCMAAL